MSQTKENDLVEDAVPLSTTISGLSPGEPSVHFPAAGSVTFQSSHNNGISSGIGARAQTAVMAIPGQQTGISSHQPGARGAQGPDPPPLAQAPPLLDEPWKKGQSSGSPQAGKEHIKLQSSPGHQADEKSDHSDSSLQVDIVKGVRQAVADRLMETNLDSGFESCKPSLLLSLEPSDDVTDEDIEKYKSKFPKHLKTDYYDAMIIYMKDDDEQQVKRFLKRVQTEVLLHKSIKPKVILYDEIFPGEGMNPIAQLDESLGFCTYVFLYVTKSFCEDGWTEFSSQTCLMDAILTPDKKWSVVPIFTEPKRKPTYRVPPSVRSLKGIQYWSEDKFYADSLRKLLEDKLEVRLEREDKQKHERRLWIMERRTDENFKLKKRQQEVEFTRKEQEIRKQMQQKVLAENERKQQQRCYVPSAEDLQELANSCRPPPSNDYMKTLFEQLPAMPNFSSSKAGSLPTSASEPAHLSELGKPHHIMEPSYHWSPSSPEGLSARFLPPLGYTGIPHPASFAGNPAAIYSQSQYPSDPRLGYIYHPYSTYGAVRGQVPPHMLDYYSLHRRYPPGYSGSEFSQPGLEDSLTATWPPLTVGSHQGPLSSNPASAARAASPQGSMSGRPGRSPVGEHHQSGQPSGPSGQKSEPPGVHPMVAYSSSPQNHCGGVAGVWSSSPYGCRGNADGAKTASPMAQPAARSQGERSDSQKVLSADKKPDSDEQTDQSVPSQQGDFHSLPADISQNDTLHQSQDNRSVTAEKPAFSSLPLELNSSSEVPPVSSRTATRLVGRGSPARTSPHKQLDEREAVVPPKGDLEEDHPPSLYESGLSQASGYDPKHLQYTEAGQMGSLMLGSVGEHVLYAQGGGHYSATRTRAVPDPQARYGHPQSHYAYGMSYPQYPGMHVPSHIPYGQSYPPYASGISPAEGFYAYRHPGPYTLPPQPEPPPPQVHYHQHYHDGPSERAPQNISIERAENVVMGENISFSVHKGRKERSQINVGPPDFEAEVTEVHMPGDEDQNIGSEGLESHRPSSHPASVPAATLSQSHASQLTQRVTLDQGCSASPSPSNDQYGLPELLPRGSHQHPDTHPLLPGPIAIVRPVCQAAPGNWRQKYDDENETELKKVVGVANSEEETSVKRSQT